MKKIAQKKGGKCLSDFYVNSEVNLEWECVEGHRWFANTHSVKNKDSWCMKCKNTSQKNRIEDMDKLAKKKKGGE